jgi:hypothetical protein
MRIRIEAVPSELALADLGILVQIVLSDASYKSSTAETARRVQFNFYAGFQVPVIDIHSMRIQHRLQKSYFNRWVHLKQSLIAFALVDYHSSTWENSPGSKVVASTFGQTSRLKLLC